MRGLPTEPESHCHALDGLGGADHVPDALRDEFPELLRGDGRLDILVSGMVRIAARPSCWARAA